MANGAYQLVLDISLPDPYIDTPTIMSSWISSVSPNLPSHSSTTMATMEAMNDQVREPIDESRSIDCSSNRNGKVPFQPPFTEL